MNNLLGFTIRSHGGLANWIKFQTVSAHLIVEGLTWVRKQQSGLISNTNVTIETDKQLVSFQPTYADWYTLFDTNHVTIFSKNEEIIEELVNPRLSFSGHKRETTWTRLQAFYFASYAIWIYFNAPFCFVNPDFEVTEIEPWDENGEQFRRLQVVFPERIATHSRIQTFYIDSTGLIRRHDYNVEISENVASAHYLYNYTEVQGIKFPTKRKVFVRNQDNTAQQPEPLLISIDINEITLK